MVSQSRIDRQIEIDQSLSDFGNKHVPDPGEGVCIVPNMYLLRLGNGPDLILIIPTYISRSLEQEPSGGTLLLGGGRAGREAEGEGGAPTDAALGPEPASVLFDDLAADRQAQARAAQAGLIGAGLGGEERLEDPPEVGRGDPSPGVADAQLGQAPRGVGPDADRTVPPSGIAWRALMTRFRRTCWICAGLTRAWGRPSSAEVDLDPVVRSGPWR